MLKKVFSPVLAVLLIQFQIASVFSQNQTSSQPPRPTFEEIYKNYSFFETAELAKQYQYSKEEIEKERKELKKKEQKEKSQTRKEYQETYKELRKHQKQLNEVSKKMVAIERKYTKAEQVVENNKKKEVKIIDKESLGKDPEYEEFIKQKDELKCKILEWEIKSDKSAYHQKLQAIRIYGEVVNTQLDLLIAWPADYKKIEEEIATGKSEERKFANPQDIGLRDLGFGDPADDIEILQYPEVQEQIRELKELEYKNQYVKAYVVSIIDYIAQNSDLKMPILEENVLVVENKDINASAFPGGFIVIFTGLLEEVGSEAEFAGVISHELAHVAARHGKRRAGGTLTNILRTAVQIGAAAAGGYVGYYLAGFFLSLQFLGVTRDFELEADTLGMQYMWKAGYDSMAFMNFFEKLGKDKGHIRGSSFFHTHPPFAKRFTNALREHHFLSSQEEAVVSSDEFFKMKAQLCVDKETQKENKDKKKPTLRKKENRQKSEREKAIEHCGIKKQEQETKSFCNDPAVEQYKEEVRRQRKENPQEAPEKTRPTLKRNK